MKALTQLWIYGRTFDVHYSAGEFVTSSAFTHVDGKMISASTSIELENKIRDLLKRGSR